MEEILASIRRIITEEGDESAPAGTLSVPPPAPSFDDAPLVADVLELTQPLPEDMPAAPPLLTPSPVAPPPNRPSSLLSQATAAVTSQSLSALSNVVVRNYDGAENTLEGVVRELLKPMLREWLDAHLPELVERIVAREIERITRR